MDSKLTAARVDLVELLAGDGAVFLVFSGLSGALESVSDTMYDVCNAFLYKKSIVPASNDTREPKTVLN